MKKALKLTHIIIFAFALTLISVQIALSQESAGEETIMAQEQDIASEVTPDPIQDASEETGTIVAVDMENSTITLSIPAQEEGQVPAEIVYTITAETVLQKDQDVLTLDAIMKGDMATVIYLEKDGAMVAQYIFIATNMMEEPQA